MCVLSSRAKLKDKLNHAHSAQKHIFEKQNSVCHIMHYLMNMQIVSQTVRKTTLQH